MIPIEFRSRLHRLLIFAAVLTAAFSVYLFRWIGFCLEEDLFSYALMIPFVSAWLVWQIRPGLDYGYRPSTGAVLTLTGIGVTLLALSLTLSGDVNPLSDSRLSLQMLSFVIFFVAGAIHQLGGPFMAQILFPTVFLVFMVPLPPALVILIETGLQHASAIVSGWFFSAIGASYLQSGLVFQLPNITIEVARECSGVRSTIVLFITSLIAGYLFLNKGWQRALFSALVIPLGIARNGFRIVTIGWLCTEYGPEMIHSPIHHRGGPVFFAVSLVPLFLLLFVFRRMDHGRRGGVSSSDAKRTGVSDPATVNEG